jgi:hypothetical protein
VGNETDGIVHVTGVSRMTLPPAGEPGDQELVQIVMTADLNVWPVYLTQYATLV